MLLYHATSSAAAESIYQQRRFRCSPGDRGFAGSAVYFCEAKAETSRRYRGGKHGLPDVVIKCEVELGILIPAKRWRVNQHSCRTAGGDSVKVIGYDVFAVYDPDRIRILGFEDCRASCDWKPASCAPRVQASSQHPAVAFQEVRSPVVAAPLSMAASNHPDVEELLSLDAATLVNMMDKLGQAQHREAQSCCFSM